MSGMPDISPQQSQRKTEQRKNKRTIGMIFAKYLQDPREQCRAGTKQNNAGNIKGRSGKSKTGWM